MSPEAEIAFEQNIGADPATLTVDGVEVDGAYPDNEEREEKRERIRADVRYQEKLHAGARAYWRLIEAKVLDRRSVLTFWQLSALEQQPYIKLGELLRADMDAAVVAAKQEGYEEAEDQFCADHGCLPNRMAELLEDTRFERNRAIEKNAQYVQRIAELEVRLGLREANATLDDLEQEVERG